MADCELLNGSILKDCKTNIGGLITKMYITERSNITSIVKGSPDDKITSIVMASPAVFYTFVFNKGTSSYAESQTNDEPTGNTLVTQTITLQLNHREQEKKTKIVLLGSFKEMAIICQDSNGHYFLFGEVGGCVLRTNEGGSGVAKTDGNNYILTIVDGEGRVAHEANAGSIH